MHVMIRHYTMNGSMADLMHTVDRQFAAQLSATTDGGGPVPVPPGILGYQAVRTGADTLLTITVFQSGEHLERAQAGAAAIRESLAEFGVEEQATVSGEIQISRISDQLLEPITPHRRNG